MSLTMYSRDFENALREYQAATKKDMSEVINRALRNVGYQAARFTPKKDPATIDAELRKDKLGLKFITKKLTARKGSTYTTRKGKTRTIKRVTRKQIALRTRQFFARRKKRTGFLRAGWVAAMISAGINPRGKGDIIKDGKSKIGSGKKATPQKLAAYLGNGVWGRLNGKSASRTRAVMMVALQRAMGHVAKDMKAYARERMNKTAKKYSGRGSISSQLNSLLPKP